MVCLSWSLLHIDTNSLTCIPGVVNIVKNSPIAILPIRIFVVVCICFAVQIASTVKKLPVTMAKKNTAKQGQTSID